MDTYLGLKIDTPPSEWTYGQRRSKWFAGEPMLFYWEPLRVSGDQPQNHIVGKVFSIFNCSLVCKEPELSLFRDFLTEPMEYVPFIYGEEHEIIYAIHTLNIVDCLDLSCSEYTPWEGTSRALVHKHCFHYDKMVNAHYFKIPQNPVSHTFVSDTFKQFIEDNRLTGPVFWPIDKPGTPYIPPYTLSDGQSRG